jgi:hypothetical protein
MEWIKQETINVLRMCSIISIILAFLIGTYIYIFSIVAFVLLDTWYIEVVKKRERIRVVDKTIDIMIENKELAGDLKEYMKEQLG